MDIAHRCIPYTTNWRIIIKITNPPITTTPMGHAWYATITKKAIREMVDNNTQKVGKREDKEKKKNESYTSRQRYYGEQQYYY